MWDETSIEKFLITPLIGRNLDDKNDVSICIWEGMRNGLVSHSGKEILRLLLQSDRSAVDCKRELERGEDYAMNLIIRKWVQLPINYEFRCFFTNHTINAITQYFNNCFFQEVVDAKDKLEQLMLDEWDKVKNLLPFENGIVDFVVDLSKERAYIIEFNPLDLFTGDGLFDYYEDWDVIVGNKPREFRIIESLDGKQIQHELEGTVSSFSVEIQKARKRQNDIAEVTAETKEENCLVM